VRRCLLAALALLGCGCSSPAVVQPMDFSHKRHQEAEVDCLTCHEQAADAPAATLPPLRVCTKCHKEIQGKDPEPERLINEAVLKKQEVPWVQVNRLAGHVYFSHRVHVGFAELTCDACHGEMAALDHPLAEPNAGALTMSQCISCHQLKKATVDCIACHK
jgi:hypothetical protein